MPALAQSQQTLIAQYSELQMPRDRTDLGRLSRSARGQSSP